MTTFRTRMSSVYATSGMSAVSRDRPVTGMRNAKSASDGMVKSTLVAAIVGT